MDCLVSVLVPVYKVERYIERCARSLMEQEYPNIEYIFVDDASPDNSMKILQSVIDQYPERSSACSIVRHQVNRGLAAARNTAIEHARGVFVCHVDSDDWLEKDAISFMVELQRESGADIVSGSALEHFSQSVTRIDEPMYQNRAGMLEKCLDFFHPLNHTVWRRLIRLSLYRDHDISLQEGINQGEDYQALPRLVYFAKIVRRSDKIVYHYNRENDGSYMSSLDHDLSLWRQDLTSYSVAESFFCDKEKHFMEAASKTMEDAYFSYLRKAVRHKEKAFWREIKDELRRRGTRKRGIVNLLSADGYLLTEWMLNIRSGLYSATKQKRDKSV